MNVAAQSIVDIFGTNDKTAQKILKKYGKEVGQLEETLNKEALGSNASDETEKRIKDLFLKRMDLLERIRKENAFLDVDFQTIHYPGKKNLYTTIEVIERDAPERLKFLTLKSHQAPAKPRKDVIGKMQEYVNTSFSLIINNKMEKGLVNCPVYHCFLGFENPELKPFLSVFNTAAKNQKKLIIDTLNKDRSPQRRAAAVLLMGHFSDPKEIISLLLPHVNDKNDEVRNNVSRVIGATMEKANIHDIDVKPFLAFLNSPYTTDRNKALYVLSAATSPASKQQIIEHSNNQLIALLKLKQPNNHDIAYRTLKEISGKDFGEHNVTAWQQWLTSAQKMKAGKAHTA